MEDPATAGIYTGSNNDPQLLKEFHLDPKKERLIRKSCGNLDQMPNILVVTETLAEPGSIAICPIFSFSLRPSH